MATRDTVFCLEQGETLLEGLERTGHHVEYQCRSGFCGACRLQVVAGVVTYTRPPLAMLGPSELLPCCCSVGESIIVDCSRCPDRGGTLFPQR
ncbi:MULTISPECIES: class I ribonucleotide reductase maintenance protein YfaE [Stenotrophomonas]|uniref:class I ribonucleotide reductase maintenance protein YfaE n=1 Tax=Stenotrophomonas TaxID=40323 RepID=UPI001C8BE42D|nr:class I ribonucleotide reductase maintenance protein YfaE [Stenotrophomonas maltophilia]